MYNLIQFKILEKDIYKIFLHLKSSIYVIGWQKLSLLKVIVIIKILLNNQGNVSFKHNQENGFQFFCLLFFGSIGDSYILFGILLKESRLLVLIYQIGQNS